MPSRIPALLLWLFVVNLGIALGAGLYEGRIVVPTWSSTSPEGVAHWNAAAARADDTGLRFWVGVSTVPLTLLTLANLVAAWRASGRLRRWWLAASAAALADRVITFAWFIPTMVGLMAVEDSPEAAETAARWAALNNVRHAIVLSALLLALKAFSLLYAQRTSTSAPRNPT